MKHSTCWLAVTVLSMTCDASPIAYEAFDYTPSSALSGGNGGSGWFDAWFQDGESAVSGATGLGFTDALGNILDVAGFSADTTGAATTRSFRDFESSLLNDVWISFLYQLPASDNKFEGVSFYRGSQQVFTVSSPSNTTTANIYLTNNLTNNGVNTQHGVFGTTHLVVLKLTKGGGGGGADRVEAFVDPTLSGNPSSPAATIEGADFDFNRVRIAGQDGGSLLVDELRVGDAFEDVTPHSSVADDDSDDDGLTDAQEAVLGLDPNVSDAALIAGIQAHPDWFDLYTDTGILGLANGGVILPRNAGDPVDFIFEVEQSEDLVQWGVLETFSRQVELPAGRNFLRVTLQNR